MILFFSDHCPYCRTLLEEIKRKDSRGLIKLVSVEAVAANGKRVPQNIHSVPALMLMPSKDVLFGKAVFDYLFLPSSGKLVTSGGGEMDKGMSVTNQNFAPTGANNGNEPAPFTLASGISEAFTFLEGPENLTFGNDFQKTYNWTTLDEAPAEQNMPRSNQTGQIDRLVDPMAIPSVHSGGPSLPIMGMSTGYNEETRKKKEMPNIDNLRKERDLALKNYLNDSQLPPPSATR